MSVAVPWHPFSALSDADGCWMFVSVKSDKGSGAVVVLRNTGGLFEVERTVALNTAAHGEALSHDGKVLVVAGDRGTSVLDVAKLEHGDGQALLGVLSGRAEDGAVYAAISPDDKLLFVADEYASRISVFDLAKARADGFRGDALLARIPVAPAPVGLSFSPDGQWLYATSQRGPQPMKRVCKPEQSDEQMHAEGVVAKIDVAKAARLPMHSVAAAWPAGCNPVRVAVSPSGKALWVTARGSNALLRIQLDEEGHADVATFPIGDSPVGVAVRPDGKQVWGALSNRFEKGSGGQLVGLEPLDGSGQIKRLSVAAPGFPRELSFLPDGRTLVATLFEAKQLQFVPTPD